MDRPDTGHLRLERGFDVDIEAAVDMDDGGFAGLDVDDEGLRMRRRLRGDKDGQGNNNWQRKPGIEGLRPLRSLR